MPYTYVYTYIRTFNLFACQSLRDSVTDSSFQVDCKVNMKVGHAAIDLIVVPILAERRCHIAAEGSL